MEVERWSSPMVPPTAPSAPSWLGLVSALVWSSMLLEVCTLELLWWTGLMSTAEAWFTSRVCSEQRDNITFLYVIPYMVIYNTLCRGHIFYTVILPCGDISTWRHSVGANDVSLRTQTHTMETFVHTLSLEASIATVYCLSAITQPYPLHSTEWVQAFPVGICKNNYHHRNICRVQLLHKNHHSNWLVW